MQDHCRNINEHLTTLRSNTNDLLKGASELQAQKAEVDVKVKILEDLTEFFQLSPSDIEALRAATIQGDGKFFAALHRANMVEKNCKRLLQSDKQTLGLSMLDATHNHLENAYKRLYQWSQGELRAKTQELPEFSPLLRKSILELQARPVLFKYALDEYMIARRDYTVTAFINALTIGDNQLSRQLRRTNNVGAKPMELHAHDPVRYTSDMLAWIHQLTASESEASEQLMRDVPRDTPGLSDMLQSCLDGITGALSPPFKIRMEQLLVSQQDGLLLYRINNVLRFYEHTLCGLLSDSTVLFVTIRELQELSWRLLFNSLNQYSRQALEQPEFPPSDLSVSDTVQDTLQLLLQILSSHDISLLPEAVRKTTLKEIIDVLVTPLTVHCQQSADQLLQSAVTHSDLLVPTSDEERNSRPSSESVSQLRHRARSATYLANCIYRIESALADVTMRMGGGGYANEHIERLSDLLNSSVDSLVAAQVACVLNQTRLDSLWQQLHPDETRDPDTANFSESEGSAHSNNVKEENLSVVSEVKVADAMVRFDVYLSNPDRSCLPELQLLTAQRLRKVVRRRAADAIHSYYHSIYAALSKLRCTPTVLAASSELGLHLPVNLRNPEDVAALILNF